MIRWYVIHSKYRNEGLLWQQFCSRGIEAYYPCTCTEPVKPRTRRVKPYFPGYLFIHADLEIVGTSTLQWIPGAVGLVHFGSEPAFVSEEILNAIRGRVNEINKARTLVLKDLKTGEEIAVHSGPFAGYHGIFDSYISDRERVTVFLRFIRDQQVRVELPAEQIALRK
jgi:transcriptional antiterminator RfaH